MARGLYGLAAVAGGGGDHIEAARRLDEAASMRSAAPAAGATELARHLRLRAAVDESSCVSA